MTGTLVNSWTASYNRNPLAYGNEPPPLLPLTVALAGNNTAGNWLFCVVGWRQDAGTAGFLQYTSTMSICDDIGNFWIPVSTSGTTGICRTSIWMAPAARTTQNVYVGPTAFQQAAYAAVYEFTSAVPWYSFVTQATGFTNQGTTISVSEAPAAGLFTIAILACDNSTVTLTPSAPSWSAATNASTSNGINTFGDMHIAAFYRATPGGTITVSGTASGTADLSLTMVTVHGVTDTIAFPYTQAIENWPIIVTEIGAPPFLNVDQTFVHGTTNTSNTANCTLAAKTWPLFTFYPNYTPTQSGSLQVTPSGSASSAAGFSETEAVNPVSQYSAVIYAYSVNGLTANLSLACAIQWFDSGHASISTTTGTFVNITAGEWTLLTVPPSIPPANAAFAAVGFNLNCGSGNVPAAASLYIGFWGFSQVDAYQVTPPDQVQWFDLSSRQFTQQQITWSRGIQYEQQSLEAGTLAITFDNNDGLMTFGNVLSPYFPSIGDTDVPIRVRAIQPQSLTPFYPIFTGFTDQITYGWDNDTWRGWAEFGSSDQWSRLTQQMLLSAEQEVLEDNPLDYWTCDQSGSNLVGNGPLLTVQNGPFGPFTGATNSFTGNIQGPPGLTGVSAWAQVGITGSNNNTGSALSFFPNVPFTVGTHGFTAECWFQLEAQASEPTSILVIMAAATAGGQLWQVWVDNTNGTANSALWITTYANGVATNTKVAATQLLTTNVSDAFYVVVTWTTSSLTIAVNSKTVFSNSFVTSTIGVTFGSQILGFSWGGTTGPFATEVGGGSIATNSWGFSNVSIFGAAIYPLILPQNRIAAHYWSVQTAFASELDVFRMARIAGYSGFVPTLAMRGWDLNGATANADIMTPATDVNSQIVSQYFTNIASTTLSAMFVNGAGALVYRRRLDWYAYANALSPQWVFGDNPAVNLLSNPLNTSASIAGWTSQNGATLSTQTGSPGVGSGPQFADFSGVFIGNGSTGNPQIAFDNGATGAIPVTPGLFYQLSASTYSPQGWTAGQLRCYIVWYTAGGASISSTDGSQLTQLQPANSQGFIVSGSQPFRAPATAAKAGLYIYAFGTPAASIHFFIANVQFIQVPYTGAGPGLKNATSPSTAVEAPYLIDMSLSSDRAQLFNQAVITQYGSFNQTVFQGSGISFTPTTGVVVQVVNTQSAALRGEIPYAAQSYSNNTVQATPFFPNQPSIEDLANWITNTLSAPLFRPDRVTLTPVATPAAQITALNTEVGDTVVFRRRAFNSNEVQILTFCNKLTGSIDISTTQFTVQFQIATYPAGTCLTTDDVIHGVLTGGNVIGW